jgi:hypothetical protein
LEVNYVSKTSFRISIIKTSHKHFHNKLSTEVIYEIILNQAATKQLPQCEEYVV